MKRFFFALCLVVYSTCFGVQWECPKDIEVLTAAYSEDIMSFNVRTKRWNDDFVPITFYLYDKNGWCIESQPAKFIRCDDDHKYYAIGLDMYLYRRAVKMCIRQN